MNRIFKVFGWGQKHWIAVALIVLVLLCLSSFFFYLFTFINGLLKLLGKLLPDAIVKQIADVLTKTFNEAAANPWLFAAIAIVVFPPAGWLIALWLLLDLSKHTTVTPSTPANPPAGPEPAPLPPNLTDFGIGVPP